jgi:hypothetical protein
MAETVLMNLLRGDISRLQRCTHITTGNEQKKKLDNNANVADSTTAAAVSSTASPASTAAVPSTSDAAAAVAAPAASSSAGSSSSPDAASLLASAESFRTLPRCKPFKYAYEKEIVLYAYYRQLDYFSTECIYSPNAYRGFARELLKEMEKARPRAIVDIVRSGEHFLARQDDVDAGVINKTPTTATATSAAVTAAASSEGATVAPAPAAGAPAAAASKQRKPRKTGAAGGSVPSGRSGAQGGNAAAAAGGSATAAVAAKAGSRGLGVCERCGYISSNALCKACVLLEGLNRGRPRVDLKHEEEKEDGSGGSHDSGSAAPIPSSPGANSISFDPQQSRAARGPVGLFISDGSHAADMASRVAVVQTQMASKATTAGPSAEAAAKAAESATSARARTAAAMPGQQQVATAAGGGGPTVSAALHMAQQRNATDW